MTRAIHRLRATPYGASPAVCPHAAGVCPPCLGGTYNDASAMRTARIRERRVGVPSTYANGLRVVQEFDGGTQADRRAVGQRASLVVLNRRVQGITPGIERPGRRSYSLAHPCEESPVMVAGAYGPAMDRDTGGDCVDRHLFVIGYP